MESKLEQILELLSDQAGEAAKQKLREELANARSEVSIIVDQIEQLTRGKLQLSKIPGMAHAAEFEKEMKQAVCLDEQLAAIRKYLAASDERADEGNATR